MSNYTESRDQLNAALNFVTPDSPEWIKTMATIAALDQAEIAEAAADFIGASRRIDDAVAKLRAILAGVAPNMATQFLDRVRGALTSLTPVVENVKALLSGEPASALPGMAETNQPSFPSAAAPIVPPVRELARAGAAAVSAATGEDGVARMIEDILRREGGFVNHPNDRGGATNFGITLRTLAAARGRPVSVDDVRNLTLDEARRIYRANYCTRPKIDRLPALLQPILFDMSINHGPGTAIRLLQEALNDAGQPCDVDGGIGDQTIAAARRAADALGNTLVNRLVDRRVGFFQTIVAGDASQGVFLRGWLNRANEFRTA
jgi:Glycosyl hydrolase 108/Predicted Peptidoglycan domain